MYTYMYERFTQTARLDAEIGYGCVPLLAFVFSQDCTTYIGAHKSRACDDIMKLRQSLTHGIAVLADWSSLCGGVVHTCTSASRP